MRDSERARLVGHSKVLLAGLDPYRTVSGMLLEVQGRPRAGGYEQDRVSGHSTVLDEEGVPMPAVADPTGEAAIVPDRAARDLARYDHLLRTVYSCLAEASQLDAFYRHHDAAERPSDDPGKDWCRSCWRDGNYAEPVDDRYKGKRLCRWCGDWDAAHGEWPPRPIICARHRGERITLQLIEKLTGKKAS